MLVDTHAHLQWASFDKDRDKVIHRAKANGVKCIVNVGFDVESSRRAIQLAEGNNGLYATVGVHPHNAAQYDEATLKELKELSRNENVVAIGETGLDYYRNLSSRTAQKRAFEAQLELAEQLDLPAVIHNREAHQEVYEMLSRFRSRIHFIMHCYSGSAKITSKFITLGCFLSFAGPVTFPNSRKLQQTAKSIDLHRILIETDSPWLSPQTVRGRRNEPANLVYTARKMAELKELSVDEFSRVTTENAIKIYRLPVT